MCVSVEDKDEIPGGGNTLHFLSTSLRLLESPFVLHSRPLPSKPALKGRLFAWLIGFY